MAGPRQSPKQEPVPALVVSGFLGSGKTSLVRRALVDAQSRGLRLAVVSNELGELGIDRSLLGSGAEAFVELEGGCVCCELSDDLVNTLELLRKKVDPDRVVVETSGVALPFDTQLNFWRDPVRGWIGEDTAIVVVNAEQLREGRDLEGTFEDQVTSADLLVLNKTDLVPASELNALEAQLRELEPDAPIVRTRHGEVDPALLFPPSLEAPTRSGPPPTPRPHHHEAFETAERRIEPGVSAEALERELSESGLLRAKGYVETDAGVRLVQLVGRRVDLTEPDTPPASELLGRLVTIRRRNAPPTEHNH
ncbi:MAG: GTP-binding protein [Proteobacteria bacterium]|nr:GTP-binding protein [Pseudomonadota bacterium]